MAEFPALPIWTDAYMLDCGHLTDAEHGRYFLLLMLIWRSPECRIPNEPEWVSRKLKRTLAEYESDILPLINEFCKNTGNWITQKRLSKEFLYLQKKSKSQSDKANLRWTKEKVSYRADAPTPTPKYIGKKVWKEEKGATLAGTIPLDENDPRFKTLEAEHRKKLGKGYPRTTVRINGYPSNGWYFTLEEIQSQTNLMRKGQAA